MLHAEVRGEGMLGGDVACFSSWEAVWARVADRDTYRTYTNRIKTQMRAIKTDIRVVSGRRLPESDEKAGLVALPGGALQGSW